MPERDGYIPGVPCWVDTTHPDPEAAAGFYGRLFGWELGDVMPPDLPGQYFMARIRSRDVAGIGSIPEGAPRQAMWNTYVCVESADRAAAKVREAGGSVIREPFEVMEAGRMAVSSDPEGAVFCAWEPRRMKGAQLVNEHATLVFNVLNTRDPAAARPFYRAVFGWETISPKGGAEMWTRPGYGDHLERDNPGLRERMAEMGAPEGFADVVASIAPIPAEQAGAPAHWGVTFAVDDADAIAARAAELGGEVIAGPFDAPWVRMAVLADPQGATFTASKFVPENRDLAAPAGGGGS